MPPAVTSSTPANLSANTPVTSPVNVTFSQGMNPSTINASTFTLTVGGAAVSGTVSYDAASRVASFVPTGGLLAEGKSYVAKVTTGVRNVSGKALTSDFVLAFLTSGFTSAPGTTGLWGMVVDESGICIEGATVLVVRGQRAGETMAQKTPCGVWDYDGGFFFENLTVGVGMTLQASAPGFEVQEQSFFPSLGPQTALIFSPK
ncbi:MAG: Ig-like domain-containing protein, partial [Gemmatimonadaceae bacterium]